MCYGALSLGRLVTGGRRLVVGSLLVVVVVVVAGVFEADDACPDWGDNHRSQLHHEVFGGMLKLIDNNVSLNAIDEFLERIQKKLWSEDEKILEKVNLETIQKFKREL